MCNVKLKGSGSILMLVSRQWSFRFRASAVENRWTCPARLSETVMEGKWIHVMMYPRRVFHL